ncbi:copper metallochaperone [Halorhodospira halochloris]|uniref:Copper metallochaperone n=1 Tax=Halorhodospira halochloris TaxID=1052 RepID=A0A0X8XAW5_HALHR|nr:copper chaperone PCu(A)C [Halorhodospira halochloris]MBK1651941.1 hypothetical protein [Halorhodospira halochloris]BAU58232.1 copper metallochaperone [Halorhodospira halochloris]
MSLRNWVAIATAALLATPSAVGQDRGGQPREGVRLPILGQDREPIDMLKMRPEEVERELQRREQELRPPTLARALQPLPDIPTDAFDFVEEPTEEPEEQAAEAVEVEGFWVAESRPGEGTIQAELDLANRSESSHSLVYVYTDAAEEAILHITHWIAGVRHVQRLEELHLPPEQRVELRPGGPRLLLVDLRRPLSRGEVVSVTLQFADGSRKTVEAPVHSYY